MRHRLFLLNLCSSGGVGIAQFATGRIYAAYTPADWEALPFMMIFIFFAAALAVGLLIYLFSTDSKPDTA